MPHVRVAKCENGAHGISKGPCPSWAQYNSPVFPVSTTVSFIEMKCWGCGTHKEKKNKRSSSLHSAWESYLSLSLFWSLQISLQRWDWLEDVAMSLNPVRTGGSGCVLESTVRTGGCGRVSLNSHWGLLNEATFWMNKMMKQKWMLLWIFFHLLCVNKNPSLKWGKIGGEGLQEDANSHNLFKTWHFPTGTFSLRISFLSSPCNYFLLKCLLIPFFLFCSFP